MSKRGKLEKVTSMLVATLVAAAALSVLTTAPRTAHALDVYRRFTSPKSYSCASSLSGVSVRFADQNVEFSGLPANAQWTSTYIGGLTQTQTQGPFSVEQTSGTKAYAPFLQAFPSYPFTFEYRVETLVDGHVVYRSSLTVTCAGDGTGTVIPQNAVVNDPDVYRRWSSPIHYTCKQAPGQISIRFDYELYEFNNVPAGATYTETRILNGQESVLSPRNIERSNGVVIYLPLELVLTGGTYPLNLEYRIDTIVGGTVVYTSTLLVTCGTPGSGSAVPINDPHPGGPLPSGASSEFVPLDPARLADSRPDGHTIDGVSAAFGLVAAGTTVSLQVAGRGGVASDAPAAALNVTAVDAVGSGFVTVFPCDQAQPTASNVNYVAGAVVPNAVLARIGSGGRVCFFVSQATHLVVDVDGYFPTTTKFQPLVPSRLLDTRPGLATVDGLQAGNGANSAGTTLVLNVNGRGGVDSATAVALNVTITEPAGDGFVTVYPCGAPRPLASSLNYTAGATVANLVISKVGSDGTVCIFTQQTAHVVADVDGYFPASTPYVALQPARLLDSRPGNVTVDGLDAGFGPLARGFDTTLVVVGRGGVPAGTGTVALNVTAIEPQVAGFITVYPCGIAAPLASNLNYVPGQTVPNAVLVKVGRGGAVCFHTSQSTQLVVDVVGYFPAD